jgi:uncharacterized phage protein (TIGR02220 family)
MYTCWMPNRTKTNIWLDDDTLSDIRLAASYHRTSIASVIRFRLRGVNLEAAQGYEAPPKGPKAKPAPPAILEVQEPEAPKPSRSRSSKIDGVTTEEKERALRVLQKLTEKNGIKYRGGLAHIHLLACRMRDGVTEGELRAVIALQWAKWHKDPAMGQWMRPETLFGPTAIHRYLDEARTRYAAEIAEVDKSDQMELPMEAAS